MTRSRGRLILHVGTHKTGTTSFQESLKVNAEDLAARGIGAVGEGFVSRDGDSRIRYNLMGLADLFIRPELATGYRLRRRMQSRALGPGAAWQRGAGG